MIQKFLPYQFVHVCKEMPEEMRHFHSDFDGIVKYTYSEAYGSEDYDSYSIYQIQEGKVVNCIAWYKENQLTLLPEQDLIKAKEMVEEYRRPKPPTNQT